MQYDAMQYNLCILSNLLLVCGKWGGVRLKTLSLSTKRAILVDGNGKKRSLSTEMGDLVDRR